VVTPPDTLALALLDCVDNMGTVSMAESRGRTVREILAVSPKGTTRGTVYRRIKKGIEAGYLAFATEQRPGVCRPELVYWPVKKKGSVHAPQAPKN